MRMRDVQTEGCAVVEVHATGDLTVAGWNQSWLQVAGDDAVEEAPRDEANAVIRLAIRGDGRLRLPAGLTTRIVEVRGDARLREIAGPLELADVRGDARLEEVNGDIRVGTVSGDIRIQRVRGAVYLASVEADLHVAQIDGPLTCDRVSADLKVATVSGPVSVTQRVGADLAIAGVGGPVQIGQVSGDLSVLDSGTVQVEAVAGDFTARGLRGALHVAQIGGDAQVESCAGPVLLDAVGGDLKARGLAGGISAPSVGGKVRLHSTFAAGQTYDLTAGGTATIFVDQDPSTLSATFELRRSDGRDVDVELPLADVVTEPGYLRGRIGDGEATVRVTAGGSLRVGGARQEGPGFEGFFEGLFDEIGEGFRGMFEGFSGFNWGDVNRMQEDHLGWRQRQAEEKTREAAQRLAEKTERQVRRATERAQRQAERAARHAERFAGQWRWFGQAPAGRGWPTPPAPPPPAPPPRPKATDAERLAILKMLAEGTITADDAARLLEALGS